MTKLIRTKRADFQREEVEELAALWEEVWPGVEGTLAEKTEALWRKTLEARELGGEDTELTHRLWVDGEMVAVSRSYHREIKYMDTGEPVTVLALLGVCARPAEQGKGYGRRVVEDAFLRLEEEGLGVSLFQTGVPGFYEKLGGRTVDNRFFNLRGENAEATPWWEDYAVIYPANGEWRNAPVDLQGPGY